MNRSTMFSFSATLLLASICMAPGSVGIAQQPTSNALLVGTWTLVLVDNVLPDGSRIHLYGPDPRGILTFDSEGRYALQIYRAARAKFASGDKSKTTPAPRCLAATRTSAAIQSIPPNAAFSFIEHASFPNWDGIEQKRAFAVSADELTYTVPTPTSGGTAIGEVKWRRAR